MAQLDVDRTNAYFSDCQYTRSPTPSKVLLRIPPKAPFTHETTSGALDCGRSIDKEKWLILGATAVKVMTDSWDFMAHKTNEM